MNAIEKRYKETMEKIRDKQRVPLLKIIRMKCADCVCWQEKEISRCQAKDCILWAYRMGKNPTPKKMSKERIDAFRKAVMSKNLK